MDAWSICLIFMAYSTRNAPILAILVVWSNQTDFLSVLDIPFFLGE